MAISLNTELSAFLSNVWENRDWLLYGSPLTGRKETIEDRVYDLYAPEQPRTAGMTARAYKAQIDAINKPVISRHNWRRSIRGGFHVWDNSGCSGSVNYRLYLNVELAQAARVFTEVMISASAPAAAFSRSMASGRAALAARGRREMRDFSTVVKAAKIADEEQAFTSRPDVIVVYFSEGRDTALAFSKRLLNGCGAACFKHDHVPMTERIASGVSMGPEVSGARQWAVGTSFGEVRCNLIAKALVKCVTGKTIDQVPDSATESRESTTFFKVFKAPLSQTSLPPVGSPNRLDFFQEVGKSFQQTGIDPAAPWRNV